MGLYSDANPPPSNTPDVVQIDMPDGATIAYDHAAHALAVTLPAGGTATIAPPPPAAQPSTVPSRSTARSPSTMMCRSPALPPQPMM
ncbi:hypothetical protein [Sphingobium sp.]|uniref:hypothetical protein n=1 Tax=Sphingobium sp. TaxID=1912891 RepID=UPI00257B9122|nr:hypothetical protein [Sphingobium sp.]